MTRQDKIEKKQYLLWAKASVSSRPPQHQQTNTLSSDSVRKSKFIRKIPIPTYPKHQKQSKSPIRHTIASNTYNNKTGKMVAKVRQRCQSASAVHVSSPTHVAAMSSTSQPPVTAGCGPDTATTTTVPATTCDKKRVTSVVPSTRIQSAPQKRRSKSISSTYKTPQIQMDALNCPNHTSTDYWDSWAADWTGEIISSIDDDLNGVIKAAIETYCTSGPSSLALDFGCGVGLYLPSLAERSESVLGLDISRKLIAIARKDCEARGYSNVRLKKTDLGTCDIRKMNLENIATFAVCANVLISPEPCTRRSILANLAAAVKPDGHVLLVVPATRSAQLIERAHGVWLAERQRLRLKTEKCDELPETSTVGDAKRGIYRRDDVRTKHYRQKEICKQLQKVQLEVVKMEKVEYSWRTEFDTPVDILEETFEEKPFDWLVIAKRVNS